jgi:hypothetical protein
MKPSWTLLAIAVPACGALALLALVAVTYGYGNQPSMPDMELAAELGAAIGGVLTFTWPFRSLLKR